MAAVVSLIWGGTAMHRHTASHTNSNLESFYVSTTLRIPYQFCPILKPSSACKSDLDYANVLVTSPQAILDFTTQKNTKWMRYPKMMLFAFENNWNAAHQAEIFGIASRLGALARS